MQALILLLLAAYSHAQACDTVQPVADATIAPVNSTSTKLAVAHFMVGNTYPYLVADWSKDIALAASKGIDGFALNTGRDTWQSARVADAYTAAKNFTTVTGTAFKLFMSFDMSSLPCTATGDAATLQTYIKTYNTHPNQLKYNNKTLISTFAGESCRFGQSSLQTGWAYAVKNSSLPAVHFMPSFFVDPATFSGLTVMDGAFNWNGGWPQTNANVSFSTDTNYINNLGNRSYMAAVSPWFFTHYGVNSYNKNFIYRGDDWLLSTRWELLLNNRPNVSIAQIITWNDYGESHYIGPIAGAQPNSQSWVNGFDHTGWLDLIAYYVSAFKTGIYPTITRDRAFLWARLYPAAASSNDTVPKPTNWQWTSDTLWAVVLLTKPTNVTLACGASTNTTALPAGLAKLRLTLVKACSVNATFVRNGTVVLSYVPKGFNYSLTPPSYNFNAFVGASP